MPVALRQKARQVRGAANNYSGDTNAADVALALDNDADILSVAGTVSGGGTAAAGVAVSVNEVGGDVTAQVADSTLRATGAVNVQATTSGSIESVAAGVAGGGSVALAGSNTTNAITSTVLAQMDTVTQAASSSSLRVQALDSFCALLGSFAGNVALTLGARGGVFIGLPSRSGMLRPHLIGPKPAASRSAFV